MSSTDQVQSSAASSTNAHARVDELVEQLHQLAEWADRNYRDYLLAELATRWNDFDPEGPSDRWRAAHIFLRGLDEGYEVDPSVESVQHLLNDLLIALDEAVSEEYGGDVKGLTVRSMRRVLMLYRELGAALEQWQQSLS
jgi:hypothetical protein